MKIKTGFMMREVAGKFVAVPVGVGQMILKECCKPIKREHFSGNYLRKNRRKKRLFAQCWSIMR